MNTTQLVLLLSIAVWGYPAVTFGQRPRSADSEIELGDTITVTGALSSVDRERFCWMFIPVGQPFVGVGEFPGFSAIGLPEEFRHGFLRVTLTGRVQSRSDRGCFLPREIVVRSIEMADGPQLRQTVYDAMLEAQRCFEANNNNCAAEILDEIEAAYDLNTLELWQLWNFRALIYIGDNEFPLLIHALEEILMLGDMTEWFAPEPWVSFVLLVIGDERYSVALRMIDLVCEYRSCDELRDLRSEAVSAMQATSP